jgi:DNA-nicking Smr family endonuclease
MNRARAKPGDRPRTITADEAELWAYATRSLDKVKAKARVAAAAPSSDLTASRQASPRRTSSGLEEPGPAGTERSRKAKPAPPPAQRPPERPPPLADFDRRRARQIASGRIKVDGRIDLHGLRQRDAHARLRAFLFDAYAKGLRTVLVITGKGAGEQAGDPLGALAGEHQRGVLRRSVPHWLGEPELRPIVLSFTQANPRHGGAGALYIQLRRKSQP